MIAKQSVIRLSQAPVAWRRIAKGIMGSLGTREEGMMHDNSEASGKMIWERKIKQNMVPSKVNGRQFTYSLDHTKNSAVEIHFETRNLADPCDPKMEPVVGRRSDTFDISGAEFLVLSRNPALNTYRHHIPWTKILEIVFLDA
jgi:hypothetical protein